MAKGREINFNLPSADDLFSTQEERDEAKREMIMEICIEEICDFPNHHLKSEWMKKWRIWWKV